jgi:SAM-dependent methyltransferase
MGLHARSKLTQGLPMTVLLADNLPRMSSAKDLDCVKRAVAAAPEGGTAVEFGPWLGALSVPLASRMKLHAVDNFRWTADHDRRVPDLAGVGDSFRPALERNIADAGLSATIHESAFDAFRWDGGAIDLVLIDGPKTASALAEVLASVAGHLAPDARVLVKNALAPLFSDIAAYMERLIDEGVFTLPEQSVPRGCSILTLSPGPRVDAFDNVRPFDPAWTVRGSLIEQASVAADHPYRFVKVVAAIRAADFDGAFEELAQMPPEPRLAGEWPKILKKELITASNEKTIATLSELVAFHHEQDDKAALPVSLGKTREDMLRGYWANNRDNSWRAGAYQPEILTRAFDFGYMDWPNKIREHCIGKDILDIGCGPGLHGLGYIAVGAKSYLGLDPILKPDQDRSKNLEKASRKEAFGWTPNQISRLIAPWHASPEAVGDTSDERRFDLCTMHNVTEHLIFLDEIFADIAARLRPGGKLLYNHHNFYAWNGHHQQPKNISKIDPDDPAQAEFIDWNHLSIDPAPDHYFRRGLNRIRLDELIALTEKHFDVEVMDEIPSSEKFGGGRLTDEIRQRYPQYDDRELTTQNLFCIATVRI